MAITKKAAEKKTTAPKKVRAPKAKPSPQEELAELTKKVMEAFFSDLHEGTDPEKIRDLMRAVGDEKAKRVMKTLPVQEYMIPLNTVEVTAILDRIEDSCLNHDLVTKLQKYLSKPAAPKIAPAV